METSKLYKRYHSESAWESGKVRRRKEAARVDCEKELAIEKQKEEDRERKEAARVEQREERQKAKEARLKKRKEKGQKMVAVRELLWEIKNSCTISSINIKRKTTSSIPLDQTVLINDIPKITNMRTTSYVNSNAQVLIRMFKEKIVGYTGQDPCIIALKNLLTTDGEKTASALLTANGVPEKYNDVLKQQSAPAYTRERFE